MDRESGLGPESGSCIDANAHAGSLEDGKSHRSDPLSTFGAVNAAHPIRPSAARGPFLAAREPPAVSCAGSIPLPARAAAYTSAGRRLRACTDSANVSGGGVT